MPVSIGSDGNSCCTSISELSPWKLHGGRDEIERERETERKSRRERERETEAGGILAAVIVA